MLKIGCAKIDLIISMIDNQQIQDIKYHCLKKSGIQAEFDHNANNDEQAKAILKKLFKNDPRTRNFFISIEILG